MRVARIFLAIALLLGATRSASAAGEYRTVEVNELRITLDSEWASQGASGYLPIRFDITNLGDDRTIEIIGRGSRVRRYGTVSPFGVTNVAVRQSVDLKRGDRIKITIPAPVFTDGETIQFQIRENDRTVENFNYFGFRGGLRSLVDIPALVVADSSSALGSVARDALRPVRTTRYYPPSAGFRGGPVPGSISTAKLDFILDPARLPTNWISFTTLAGVFIGPKEWEQLTEPQRSSLLRWVACGGNLMFVDGDLKLLFPSLQTTNGTPQNYFLGQIYFPTSTDIQQLGIAGLLPDSSTKGAFWTLPASQAFDWGSIQDRGFRLPIPNIGGVPLRAYLVILLIFTILIGPVNYLFLWRKRQQVLMVLTVPMISLLFIVLLAGYVVAGEGFGVHGRVEALTILDQVTKQAVTRATVSLYAAGMSPSGGLAFPRDMAIFPIGSDGFGSQEEQVLDLSATQRFLSGVARARSPANFEEIGFRPARERLSFESKGDQLSVLNGLEGTVIQLLYRIGGKTYEFSGRLQAGERTTMKTGGPQGPKMEFFTELKPAPLSRKKFQDIFSNQPDHSYIAVLEHSPFWESGVAKVEEDGSYHLVLGYVEGGS